MNPRFRFAPSPTGQLHVGGARTAILNWLLARHAGGAFVLRIEDTDLDRHVPEAEAAILADLRWLGLDWDEGPDVGGPYAPYRQSERSAFYAARAAELLERGHAYPCTCPPSAEGGSDRRARCACASRPWEETPSGASLRFRVPDERAVVVEDAVRGEVVFPAGSIEDFVLVRGNGRATYNFAVAVDDASMRISHVIRGSDHLVNTPKQVLLYEALGEPLPRFAHIPLILGEDRQKLSKRHGATSVGEHRRAGYMPEALVNYLSLLSWSSPSGEEFLPLERLVAEVDLDRVGASDAVFDPEKLRWLSSRYIQELPNDALVERVRSHVDLAR
ncbi:MAG TPA: glutamate--tRNA ligase, partial [Longimicrobiaceae bacterium]